MTPLSYRPSNDRDEIERFKREVNLTELAASLGYRLIDRERRANGKWRGSTAASIMMRHPGTDDKIIIGREADGHWTYFSLRRDDDNGTVVDFLQARGARSLGDVRKQLRAWLHEERPRVPVELYRRDVALQRRDEAAAAAAYAQARVDRSSYLAERFIADDVQQDPRFAGTFRIGEHGNVLFPHLDPSTRQVVGFEAKNRGFTGFSPGGRKTYWASATREDDDRLVLVETSIDAFSYHQVNRHSRARYISTGGAVGPEALALIGAAIAAMPAGADLVSATDDDEGGRTLHAQLLAAGGRALRRHVSPVPKDWNDCLKSMHREHARKREHRLER